MWDDEEKTIEEPVAEGIDYAKQYPNIDFFLHAPILAEPPLCTLKELEDGTYSIDDLQLFNDIIEVKNSWR